MATLDKIKINDVVLEQLWYGLEGSTNPSDYNCVYSDYACDNKFTYVESPERDLSGTLHNEDIETFYIPSVTFTMSFVNLDIYSELIQTLTTRTFTVEYYDYEIMQIVKRDMYMTESSIGNLHIVGNGELKGFRDVKFTFVSRLPYLNYDELKTKKLEDFEEDSEE